MNDTSHSTKTQDSYQVDAEKLRAMRVAEGHTQRSLADAADLDKNVVHNAERGKRIRLTSIKQLCDVLGEDVHRLIKKHPDSAETCFRDHATVQLPTTDGGFTSLQLLLEDLNGEDDINKINELLIEVVQMFADRKSELQAEITGGHIGSVHLTVTFENEIAEQLASHFPRNQAGELVVNETTLRLAAMKQGAKSRSAASGNAVGHAREATDDLNSANAGAKAARSAVGSKAPPSETADATIGRGSSAGGRPIETVPEPTNRAMGWQRPFRWGQRLARESYFRRKYVADRVLGGILMVFTAPLTLLLFLLVKLTSPGPGFYRQQRVGLDGKTFFVVKLRTMQLNAERPGQAVWLLPNDPRVTRLGRLLRASHLDELPQLYNVVHGEMCLVGPRPERPQICQELAQHIDGYYDRNRVKPGITGLAQINLPPDETIDDVRKRQLLDLQYITEANAWLDVRMILLTAMYVFGIKREKLIKVMGLCRQECLSQHRPQVETEVDECRDAPSGEVELARVAGEPRVERLDEWTLCQH